MLPFTLEAWVRRDNANCQTILSRGAGSGFPNDLIFSVGWDGSQCGSGKLGFFYVEAWHFSNSEIPINVWTHVAVTYDGLYKRFYINGVLDQEVVALPSSSFGPPPLPDWEPLYVGRQGSVCNCNFFVGAMDEVRIWNRVRTAGEIAGSRNSPLSGLEENLTGYWRFDEAGVQPAFYDSSISFRDGIPGAGGGVLTETSNAGAGGDAPRYLVLAENNSPELNLPVTLHIIQIRGGPYKGDLKVLPPDNPFDEHPQREYAARLQQRQTSISVALGRR